MICARCKTREAGVVVQTVSHNHVQKLALCAECAADLGPAGDLDSLMEALAAVPRARPHPARCPACGASFADFRKTGRFSCPECYEHYLPQVKDLLPRVHAGAYHHRGKTPGRR